MTRTNTSKSCPYSPQTGPVGCLSAPNIFPSAKETFAKGKMFWNNPAKPADSLSLMGTKIDAGDKDCLDPTAF